ncbi:hypothetical protein J6590_093056, partial [Homalodisca vitripennis]
MKNVILESWQNEGSMDDAVSEIVNTGESKSFSYDFNEEEANTRREEEIEEFGWDDEKG